MKRVATAPVNLHRGNVIVTGICMSVTHCTTGALIAAHVLHQSHHLHSHLPAEVDLLPYGGQSHFLGCGHNDRTLGMGVGQRLDDSEVLI